jgi:hypothetical protein
MPMTNNIFHNLMRLYQTEKTISSACTYFACAAQEQHFDTGRARHPCCLAAQSNRQCAGFPQEMLVRHLFVYKIFVTLEGILNIRFSYIFDIVPIVTLQYLRLEARICRLETGDFRLGNTVFCHLFTAVR